MIWHIVFSVINKYIETDFITIIFVYVWYCWIYWSAKFGADLT